MNYEISNLDKSKILITLSDAITEEAEITLQALLQKIKDQKITDLKLIYDNKIIDTWTDKKWPLDMLSEVEWLVKEQAKINVILKKDDLILTGAYGFPVPINNNTLIKVSSSEFGDVEAKFKQ